MSERQTVWILDRVAEAAFARYLAEHGTRTHAHDPVRLAAALAWPRTVAAFSDGPVRLSQLAAAHAAAVVRLRPFEEGNEAMACLFAMLFLRLNGVELHAPVMEKYTVFAALADGRLDAFGLAQWMRMRHLANRQGVEWVVQVRIRDGKVHSVSGVHAGGRARSGPALAGRRRRSLPPAGP